MGGRGSQLGAFIQPLIDAGYSVLTFDGPAHGHSSGKKTDMFEFAASIKAVSSTHDSIYGIISHSFGAACTLLALNRFNLKVTKLVLIGCPASAIWVTDDFGEKLALSPGIIQNMRNQLEKKHGNKWTWNDLSLTTMIATVKISTLLVHDRSDHEIPYEHVDKLKNANLSSALLSTEGFGHRRILRSQEVINGIINFIQDKAI